MLNLMGCPCIPFLTNKEVENSITEIISKGFGGITVAINAEKILEYSKNKEFKCIIDCARVPYADGFGAIISAKWLYNIKLIKINMPILLLETANRNKYRLFLYGATEEVNSLAANIICNKYKNITFVGRVNGYEKDKELIINQIRINNPQIVLVALGSPRQEIEGFELSKIFPNILFSGCGGALDVISGKTKRASEWFQRNNLEWFYRLIKEPKRIKRQYKLLIFLFRLLYLKLH